MSSKRPRWLLVTPDYPDAGGGIARLLSTIVEQSSGTIDWRVATTSPGAPTKAVRRATNRVDLVRGLRHDVDWVRESDEPRVVCGHAYLSGPVLAAAKLGGVPASALVYGLEILPSHLQHAAILRPLAAYSRVISISDATTARLGGIGVRSSAVKTVNPDIASVNLPAHRRERDLDSGFKLVMLSRLSERYKNVDVVLAALHLLRETDVVDRCLVVGGGEALPGYRREVERIGLQNRVQFTGPLPDPDVRELFYSSDLGIFPSRDSSAELGFEGFGLVVHEMAAAGLPVLVGEAAGAREAARPGWSLTLDPSDAWLWATTLKHLHDDSEKLAEMTDAAWRWAAQLDATAAVLRTIEALRS